MRFRAPKPIRILEGAGRVLDGDASAKWTVVAPDPSGGLLLPGESKGISAVALEPQERVPLTISIYQDDKWSKERAYAGSVRLAANEGNCIEVINHVDLESYVAAVVANEVWPTFHVEAYRAQAIIARTYALYQMDRRKNARYDITAGEGAQVYRGLRTDNTGLKAAAAAAYTRGLVCTYEVDGEDRIFSTYYHAACGGMSQSAVIFGTADDVPPLRGGVRCEFCEVAPSGAYRWGPVKLPAQELMKRLTDRYPNLASFGALEAIDVIERAAGGRAVRYRIAGTSGESYEMLAEHFRLAVGSREMRSTYCDIRLRRGSVIIENGKGFGHGLGLCQWGAHGQALEGTKAAEILRFYYPGCKLTRVY
ncbi:MAG: SpoIID/LytB domain-containing protein [Phycisphaerales bacterium]|nr:MAG: SpoIID/LytB domain-containing protein [Phycisphaerales bacterium]